MGRPQYSSINGCLYQIIGLNCWFILLNLEGFPSHTKFTARGAILTISCLFHFLRSTIFISQEMVHVIFLKKNLDVTKLQLRPRKYSQWLHNKFLKFYICIYVNAFPRSAASLDQKQHNMGYMCHVNFIYHHLFSSLTGRFNVLLTLLSIYRHKEID